MEITNSSVVRSANVLDQLMSSPNAVTNEVDIKYATEIIEKIVSTESGDLKKRKVAHLLLNVTGNIQNVLPSITIAAQQKDNTSNRILEAVQTMADELPLPSNDTQLVIKKRSVTLGIIILKDEGNIINGLTIRASETNQSGYNNIFFEKSAASNLKSTDLSTIYLPEALLSKARKTKTSKDFRVTSFLFGNSTLFPTKQEQQFYSAASNYSLNTSLTVNSKVLSAALKSLRLQNLSEDEEIRSSFLPLISVDNRPTECAFWDFSGSDGLGCWSTEGCKPDGIQNGFHKCRCNHLTNFAILMDLTGKGPPPNGKKRLALELITYIGCGISLAALVLTFISFVIFKAPRKKLPARILMCLCMSLIVTLIVFLIGITRKQKMECAVFALLLHYSVLASFCWMAVEGYSLYRYFVKVIGHHVPGFLWKASIFAWGLPLVIVAITVGIRFTENYGRKYGEKYICMVHGTPFYAAYLTPIILIVCCNLIILGFVLKTLWKRSPVRKDQKMDGMKNVRITAGCSILMGVTWIIGLFAIADLKYAVQVLFCIFNSLQGFFIFIFYCVRNQDIRKAWTKCFSYKKDRGVSSKDKVSKERHAKLDAGHTAGSNTAGTLPTAESVPLVKQSDKTVDNYPSYQNQIDDIVVTKPTDYKKTERLYSTQSAEVEFGEETAE